MFHDMLASEASSFLTVDTHFTKMLSENPRHLSFGAQFTHYLENLGSDKSSLIAGISFKRGQSAAESKYGLIT